MSDFDLEAAFDKLTEIAIDARVELRVARDKSYAEQVESRRMETDIARSHQDYANEKVKRERLEKLGAELHAAATEFSEEVRKLNTGLDFSKSERLIKALKASNDDFSEIPF